MLVQKLKLAKHYEFRADFDNLIMGVHAKLANIRDLVKDYAKQDGFDEDVEEEVSKELVFQQEKIDEIFDREESAL